MSRPLPSNNRRAVQPRSTPENQLRVAKVAAVPRDWSKARARLWVALRVVMALTVVVAGVGAAIAARRYVTTSPRFGLQDLKIEGEHRHTKAEIQAIAQVTLGQNIVDLDLDAIRARLERDPWIEHATLARRLPASLSIEVVEREAAAVIALPAGTFLSTLQGQIFKPVTEGDPADLPVITGISEADAAGDREATAQLVRRALDLATEVERVGLFGGRVQELHVHADGGITATIAGHKEGRRDNRHAVRVAFGRAGYRQKVRVGARIEGELGRRGARATTVFLDDDAHPDRIVVRLPAALPPAEVSVTGPTGKDGKDVAGKKDEKKKAKVAAKGKGSP